MSSTHNSTSTDLGLNNTHDTHLVSPLNYLHTISDSASSPYNPNGIIPWESMSKYSNYHHSELSEVDEEFFGADFHRTDSEVVKPFSNSTNDHEPPSLHPATAQHNIVPAAPTYPPSPRLTSIPNTPSPRGEAHGLTTKLMISQHELTTGLHNSCFQPFIPYTPVHPDSVQLSPEQSGGSGTSTDENIAPGVMAESWGAQQWPLFDTCGNFAHQPSRTTNWRDHGPTSAHPRGDDGTWEISQTTGQAGLDPEQRRMLGNVEVPTLKNQEEQRKIDKKNTQVLEWCSQTCSSNDGDNTNASYFTRMNGESFHQPSENSLRSLLEENGVAPVDDAVSIHENQLQDGQLYYYPKNEKFTDEDIRFMAQSRLWTDAPILPQITVTKFQPATANDAIRRLNEYSDSISLNSRTATWGTRRRSETSLTDMEGVTSGNFLSKLSINKPKDRERGRPRNNSLLDQGLHSLANIVRNKSDSKLKRNRHSQDLTEEAKASDARHNSQDALAPHSHHHKKSVPNMNTALAAITGPFTAVGATHARSGSITAVGPSPRSPTTPNRNQGFTRNIINRARSSSTQDKAAQQPGISQLWKSHGGPPVANLASPPLDAEPKPAPPPEEFDHEEIEEEDDDYADESDVKLESEEQAEPIVANIEGFKAHVRRLNPNMDPQYKWLVSKIAHQQEIRYKNLLCLRVKHLQAVAKQSCGAGRHCISLGGGATLLDAQGKPREVEQGSNGLQIFTNFSDCDSNTGEGAITEDTFPLGVPMPPSRNLPAEFECQLCFKAKGFKKPSDWTKHVHEDIQPFTCTYEKCKETKSFKRKADWVRHENERHRRLEWWQCAVADCTHPCYRKDNFLQHLVREHKLAEPKQKTKGAIKEARFTEPVWIMLEKCHVETKNRPEDEPCKFCGKTFNTWKKLTVHLAKHMEHISLPVLRLVEAKHVDANTIISPVEQILTPATPMDQQRVESSSPFPSNSVSPHMPTHMPTHMPIGVSLTSGFEQPSYHTTFDTPAHFVGMHAAMHQDVTYDQNPMYYNPYIPQIDQPHAFSPMHNGPSNFESNRQQAQGFDTGSENNPQPKMEQASAFALNFGFQHGMQDRNYLSQQPGAYSVQHNYVSNAPTSSVYPAPNMLGMSDPSFGFDHMAVSNQNYHQQPIPISRGPGSASSYENSPQTNVQQCYGQP
ncbi:hypothetical protein BJ878DRAFT_337685 [Calycina marina]|uniref:C2H2-type domain-containing protein n=1 Tax=Calycina marina TaxID=1763456 RepID=A0A9P8CGG9_9HELO|nr:hypothetical protein BJ878DRAFT_337685 [Calycina marina]